MDSTTQKTKLKPQWLGIIAVLLLAAVGIAVAQGWIFKEALGQTDSGMSLIGLYGIFASFAIIMLRNHCWREVLDGDSVK